MSDLELGVMVNLAEDMEAPFRLVREMGLSRCQICSWQPSDWTDEAFGRLTAAGEAHAVEITTFWAGWSGPAVWDFIDGPTTIGLVPAEHRDRRVEELKHAVEFAAKIGVGSITTHVGFLPEDPNDARFNETVGAIRTVAKHAKEHGLGFWFETGQETPVTLLRTIERVDTGNLGINLDTANLILYGKANPIDALDVFGQHVREIHAKDGLYPTNGTDLGREVPVGEGKVDFPRFAEKLKSIGFRGTLTIEREITGDQQQEDIRKAISLLRPLC